MRAALVDAFATWVEKVDFDGYRIDTIKHVESDFWPVFAGNTRKRLAAEGKTDFLMFGEAFDGNDQLIGSYTVPGALDSVFYFSQHFTAFANVFENAHDPTLGPGHRPDPAALGRRRRPNYGTAAAAGRHRHRAVQGARQLHRQPRRAALPLRLERRRGGAAQRAHAALHRGRDPEPLLRHRAGLLRRQRPGEPRGALDDAASRPTARHVRAHRQARAHPQGVRRRCGAATRRSSGRRRTSRRRTTRGSSPSSARAATPARAPYALVVLNTNDFQTSSTSNGATVMQTAQPAGTTLVDVLDPAQATYAVDGSGKLRCSVPAQKAMILVPAAQVVQGS